MTDLQKRMIESLQLRGMSERTQEAYVRAVRQLAQHYHKSPDLVSEEELRQYFLYIKNVKKYAAGDHHHRLVRDQVLRRVDDGQKVDRLRDRPSRRVRRSSPLYECPHWPATTNRRQA